MITEVNIIKGGRQLKKVNTTTNKEIKHNQNN